MKVDRDLVQRVAHLAQIELAEDEIPFYEKQMQDLLTFVDEIQLLSFASIDGSSEPNREPPSGSPTAASNPDKQVRFFERPDEVAPSLATSMSMSNAPKASGTSFEVPRIIE